MNNEISDRLLEILACPACDERPPVVRIESGVQCTVCGRAYAMRDGILDMLVEPVFEEPGDVAPA